MDDRKTMKKRSLLHLKNVNAIIQFLIGMLLEDSTHTVLKKMQKQLKSNY